MLSPEVSTVLGNVARIYGLDPDLVKAIAMQESGWDPWACRFEIGWKYFVDPHTHQPLPDSTRVVGIPPCTTLTEINQQRMSWGIMQVMGSVARELGFSQPFLSELCDIPTGVEYGCRKLKQLVSKYDVEDAISAYNAGHPTDSNRDTYVKSVLAYMQQFSTRRQL